MQIQLKLGGELKRYGNSGLQEFEAEGTLTVAAVLDRIGIGADVNHVLVIVNDEIVPPGEHTEFELNEQDRLAVMPQIKGG